MRTAQCPALIGHHPAPVVVFTSSTSRVTCSHLGSQDAWRWAGVGVGVASVVHSVGVVVLIRTMTPDGRRWEVSRKNEVTHQIYSVCVCVCSPTCSLVTSSPQMTPLCRGVWCVDGLVSAPCPEPSCSTPVDGSLPCGPSSPPSVTCHPHNAAAPGGTRKDAYL